jgi:hypothetical protein
MQVTRKQRIAPRKKVSLAVLCRSGVERGVGRMVNASLSGALLEPTSIRPERGAAVRILFTAPGAGRASELDGAVARHTETGFAIEFLAISNPLLDLVGEAI